jgi:hypothetical protein
MQPKIKKKLSIATVFCFLSGYIFTFNMEQSLAEQSLAESLISMDPQLCSEAPSRLRNLKNGNIPFSKGIKTEKEKRLVLELLEAVIVKCEDPYRKNADSAAMQRYLMNNQNGNYPFKRTDQTIDSERQIDRTNHQMRVEQGQNDVRERQRNAAACMYGNSGCR